MAARKRTNTKAAATPERIVEERSVKALALKQEQGRRRNNKANGTANKAKAWYFGSFTGPEITALLNGETIVKEYTKRTTTFSLVSA